MINILVIIRLLLYNCQTERSRSLNMQSNKIFIRTNCNIARFLGIFHGLLKVVNIRVFMIELIFNYLTRFVNS